MDVLGEAVAFQWDIPLAIFSRIFYTEFVTCICTSKLNLLGFTFKILHIGSFTLHIIWWIFITFFITYISDAMILLKWLQVHIIYVSNNDTLDMHGFLLDTTMMTKHICFKTIHECRIQLSLSPFCVTVKWQ